ncbi:TetR/AcrR family transcriptional regulator [Cytobacillus massiliigabonensis]|uniref:TetR/AcrR family transcriptional regulator n=1 Tax=Cytobacillus massiliigabonensis TaxID=1871011 RepID=UPI000C852BBF|nr:TetR/AcrR family transcriptional regulator [Cytobacillus massiliigabonensis]
MARERKFSMDELFSSAKALLLKHGYEGFTFSLLADQLNVSRGALYKYYENKEELITDYMIAELNQFLADLQKIEHCQGFEAQFDFLMNLIFDMPEVQQLIKIAVQIPVNVNNKVRENKEHLDKLHLDMYKHLQSFIKLGKKEKNLKAHIADGLILGFIFQTIAIPNHFGIPHAEWVASIKEIISHGMFTNN